ncbi:PASTA domain-containing protein [Micromonospora sp. RTGN7]|uniref:PASTA domain-containing protein n=1 Tax=Micromonospora sp. RTGN7 TaxID=3016526 RepID=UPI0029FF29F4|nr:PASTA domain-containing protein [Micromonospora sp. RTGN7]
MSDDRQDPPSAGADDHTRPLPGPGDETGPLPRPGETAHQPATPPVWSGRAGVPPPRPADYREPAGDDWYAEEQRGRRWWLPILLGILGLLLLGLIGAGLWLALSADDSPGPGGTPSVRPTTAPATTGAPTTEATTAGPSTTPPSTTAAAVPMPPLVGLSLSAAERILDQFGIEHRVTDRESDRPPGTVIGTDPGPGESVPAGQEVTLVVAVAPAPTTSAVEPTATTTATPTP